MFKHYLLTLIPKVKHVVNISNFCHISLCYTFYKVIKKVGKANESFFKCLKSSLDFLASYMNLEVNNSKSIIYNSDKVNLTLFLVKLIRSANCSS